MVLPRKKDILKFRKILVLAILGVPPPWWRMPKIDLCGFFGNGAARPPGTGPRRREGPGELLEEPWCDFWVRGPLGVELVRGPPGHPQIQAVNMGRAHLEKGEI